MISNKEEFMEMLRSTNREGVEQTISKLEELGFFEAPASSKFHLNYDGGLMEHSLNVCKVALKLREMMIGLDASLEEMLPKDGVIITTLLHDVCKSDIYRKCIKKQKNANGYWVDMPGYEFNESELPIGHGEKSVVILLQAGLKLKNEEIMAIRWHMAPWDVNLNSYESTSNLNTAKNKSQLLNLLSAADGLAAHMIERTK